MWRPIPRRTLNMASAEPELLRGILIATSVQIVESYCSHDPCPCCHASPFQQITEARDYLRSLQGLLPLQGVTVSCSHIFRTIPVPSQTTYTLLPDCLYIPLPHLLLMRTLKLIHTHALAFTYLPRSIFQPASILLCILTGMASLP